MTNSTPAQRAAASVTARIFSATYDVPVKRIQPGEIEALIEAEYTALLAENQRLREALTELRTAFIGTDLARGYIYAADRTRIENAMADAGAALAAVERGK